MKRVFTGVCLVACVLVGCGGAAREAVTDCYSVMRYKKLQQPSFDLHLMNVRAGIESRIDIYIQMQYERLRFEKTERGYTAVYSVLFVIRTEAEDEPVQSKEVTRTIEVATYEETVSLRADAFLQSFTLAPGTYRFEASATDQHSHVRYVKRSEVTVCNFAAECRTASTLMLLMKPRSEEKGIVLRPLFPQTLFYARDSMGIFQELYNIRRGDTVSTVISYVRQSGGPIRLESFDATMSPPYVSVTAPCPRLLDSIVHAEHVVSVAEKDGTAPFVHYCPLPPQGYTGLHVSVRIRNGAKLDSATRVMKLFRPRAVGVDIEDIVEAMRYILHPAEWDSIARVSGQVRERAIENFWSTHGGPTRRRDFETRVEEANRLFTDCTEGSRTPMGITYLVCGPPDAVECRGGLTETWYYAAGQQTMAVPFRIDRRNNVDTFYELTPYSVNEMLWRTFIDQWRRR